MEASVSWEVGKTKIGCRLESNFDNTAKKAFEKMTPKNNKIEENKFILPMGWVFWHTQLLFFPPNVALLWDYEFRYKVYVTWMYENEINSMVNIYMHYVITCNIVGILSSRMNPNY